MKVVLSNSNPNPLLPNSLTFNLLRASERKSTSWAGGETSEITITPPDSSYVARNFDYRISSATIERPGPFTQLPGFNRILCLLEGSGLELEITENDDTRSIQLNESLTPVSFSGEGRVIAKLHHGTICDFNIIYRREISAKFTAYRNIEGGKNLVFIHDDPAHQMKSVFIFCTSGKVALNSTGNHFELSKYDGCLVKIPTAQQVDVLVSSLNSNSSFIIVETEVEYKECFR